jgi:hypothetical protein
LVQLRACVRRKEVSMIMPAHRQAFLNYPANPYSGDKLRGYFRPGTGDLFRFTAAGGADVIQSDCPAAEEDESECDSGKSEGKFKAVFAS